MAKSERIVKAQEKSWSADVARMCELARQIKALDEERKNLAAVLLSRCDEGGLAEWHDEFFSLSVVELAGRESADLAGIKAAGLVQFIKKGDASRYVLARRL